LLTDDASVTVSVIVPAYNEELRMPTALQEMVEVLDGLAAQSRGGDTPFTWEVVVVNDGSKDGTAAVVESFAARHGSDAVRLLQLFRNSGKGAAVMADADGATKASDITELLSRLREVVNEAGDGAAIGSRAHMQDDAAPQEASGEAAAAAAPRVRRSALRRLLMWGVHTFTASLMGGSPIRDTQCGFKLFTRATARRIFSVLHIERWAFDVEMVYLASRLGIPMVVS